MLTGPEREEAVLTIEIDPFEARNKQVNSRNDLFADRRPDIYAPIISTDKGTTR